MGRLLRAFDLAPSDRSARPKRRRAARAIQFEPLEEKALLTTLSPASATPAEIAPTAASQNPLNQLAFLIGHWTAQVKFPNGAASPERQILNYRFNPHHSAIVLNQVIFGHPRDYVHAVYTVDPTTGQIVEAGHDSNGYSVVQIWTPTVQGSFVITDVSQTPGQTEQIATTLSKFGRNAYTYARTYTYPDGSTQVQAIGNQHRVC
jgi:hypothetical protein